MYSWWMILFEYHLFHILITSHPFIKIFALESMDAFSEAGRRCSIKIGVLKNFAQFNWKHMCQSLLSNKAAVQGLQLYLKMKLWHRYFPVNFAKSLRTPFLQKTPGQLVLHFITEKDFEKKNYWKNKNRKLDSEKMYTLENMRSSSHANSCKSLTLFLSLKTCSQHSNMIFDCMPRQVPSILVSRWITFMLT